MKPQSERAALEKLKRRLEARRRSHRLLAGIGLVGSVGWMIVLPAVAGAFLGRWLDEMAETGHRFSLSLLLVGLGIGLYSVWRFLLRRKNE
jgi:ATP synthase protein I